jgi:translocation and assembly module TamB
MKKFIYTILIFLVSLLILIVIAANSSFVIKKAADTFAPDYNISYENITGNILTGVKIEGLAYARQPLCRQIRFSWNPSKILYKRIAVNSLSLEEIDVDAIKALIASFPESDDNSSSAPFPLTVTVGSIHVTVKPFTQEGIGVAHTLLDLKELFYASDTLEVGDLALSVDTNVTKLKLQASLEQGKVSVKELTLERIDSESLQKMFMPEEENEAVTKEEAEPVDEGREKEPPNPLIPHEVGVEHFSAILKPRSYLGADIEVCQFHMERLEADIVKIMENRKHALSIADYRFDFNSSVGQITLSGNWKEDVVTLTEATLSKVDTMALKKMFAVPENNESNESAQQEGSVAENGYTEGNETVPKETSHLIPQKVVLKQLHTDLLPLEFDPVKIFHLNLDAQAVIFDVEKLLVEEGRVTLKGKTNLSDIKEEGKIVNNRFDAHITVTPNQPLFELYDLPLRREALGDIRLDVNASKEQVKVTLNARAKQILKLQKEQNQTDTNQSDSNGTEVFNVDIDVLKSEVVYSI